MKAHRVALLGLGAWMYAGAAAWADQGDWKVATVVAVAMSLTCIALIVVTWRIR